MQKGYVDFKSSSCIFWGCRGNLSSYEDIKGLNLGIYLFEGKIDLLVNLFSSSDKAFHTLKKNKN